MASAWAGYVDFLWQRYVVQAPKHGTVAAFEVVNEPNGQLWPQRGPSSRPVHLGGHASASTGSQPRRAEGDRRDDGHARRDRRLPRADDAVPARRRPPTPTAQLPRIDHERRRRRQYSANPGPFVDELLDELDRIGFRGRPALGVVVPQLQRLRARPAPRGLACSEHLGKRWRGQRLNGVAELWCTEGGCRLTRVRQRFGGEPQQRAGAATSQAEVIKEALHRHHWPQATRVPASRCLTQYTVAADPRFDAGLLDPGYGYRPALDAWCERCASAASRARTSLPTPRRRSDVTSLTTRSGGRSGLLAM